MDPLPDLSPAAQESRPPRRRRPGLTVRFTPAGTVFFMFANLAVLGLLAWPLFSARQKLAAITPARSVSPTLTVSPTPTSTGTSIPATLTTTVSPTPPWLAPLPGATQAIEQGMIILALNEGANTHLFAYQPQTLPLTRLTSGPWDDIQPAVSPDGKLVAFASNRNGYWDLYLLDVATAQVTRLTDSLAYDGAPSWSADGRWLIYESYDETDGGTDLYIRSREGDQPPIRLTVDAGEDYSPAWSPQGRQVAFISTRSGEPEVWLADLDKTEDERFHDLSLDPHAIESHPVWSPDGSRLAWSSVKDGFHTIKIWDSRADGLSSIREAGSGDWPAWSPDGNTLLALLLTPNQSYLTAYRLDASGLVAPPMPLPGSVDGLAWSKEALLNPLPGAYLPVAVMTPTPLWLPAITPGAERPAGRAQMVPLPDIEAPNPVMNEMVDDSFLGLRQYLTPRIGWDFLSSLENAFVPLTSPLDPGQGEDWLYTGRAFAFNALPINAGWIVVVREDFGPQAYWRVYLRVRFQDGSAGRPLHSQPWDFNARYSGDTTAYEQGGALVQTVPAGYWIDFTQLAASFGWERLPAVSTWRYSYPAARFNEFAFTSGVDWRSAMLELYPPEALVTPTLLVAPTRTLTPTPRWYQTPTPTMTPTPRPTLTPILPADTLMPSPTDSAAPGPTETRTPTITPTPASTFAPTLTLTAPPITATRQPTSTYGP